MDRRQFVKKLSILGTAPLLFNGLSFNVFAKNNMLEKLFAETNNDNALVLIQLHGGNDGLNTFVPISQYNKYYNIRANVALPYTGKRKFLEIDKNLSDNQRLGLHPDMIGIKSLFDEGSATVVQNVGYENFNMSHFRSRDIMFMGGGANDTYESGWIGRLLNHENPNYPTGYPSTAKPDPLAMELGNTASLAFHRSNGISMGLSIANPQSFYDLISGVGVNPPVTFPDSYYGDELQYIMQMETQANSYAKSLKKVYDKGNNSSSVDYPTIYPLNAPAQYKKNYLSEQLKIVARLISGGSGTKIFIVRIGGFDTHAAQVEPYDNSYGRHAALLYHLSASIKAFYDDLKKQSLDSKILTMTFSEFGRRVYSNASYGTDHGKAAPVMLFGPGLKGGVIGENPNLDDLDNGNLKFTNDYRLIYTSIVQDWLGASDQAMADTYFDKYISQKLDLFETSSSNKTSTTNNNKNKLDDCFPNPVKTSTVFSYYLDKNDFVKIYIHTTKGDIVKTILNKNQTKGIYKHEIDLSSLPNGIYLYTLETANERIVKKFVKN